MMWSWLVLVLSSMIMGALVTILVQFYFIKKYFTQSKIDVKQQKLSREPFKLPEILVEALRSNLETRKGEGCAAVNVLFQFLFHELRDTSRVRKWFRNKLTVEFEELLTRTAIGKMFGSIKVRDISLGLEFPIINSIVIDDVKINEEFSHIDSLDLKLDLSYKGGFRLIVDANMLLGKAAYLSIKVGELYGLGRLQFTRLPYSHWSFSFYEDPKLELEVESQFQGRPLPQITTLISNQIRKSVRKKHTLPNYKLRYKPFFSTGEESAVAEQVPTCSLNLSLHHISRLPTTAPKDIYCLIGLDAAPWIDLRNYSGQNYFVIDVIVTKTHSQPIGITFKQEFLSDHNKVCVVVETSTQQDIFRGDVLLSIDGKKIGQTSHVPKAMKTSAVLVTLRVERRAPDVVVDRPGDVAGPEKSPESARLEGCKDGPLETDSSASSSVSNSPAKLIQRDVGETKKENVKQQLSQLGSLELSSANNASRLIITKTYVNNQIVLLNDNLKMNVLPSDMFVNIAVRGEEEGQPHPVLVSYANIPLSKLVHSPDSLHCFQLKPPDSFAASNSRNHPLSSQNGFIPLLCYGDIVLSAEASGEVMISSPSRVNPSTVCTPNSESPSRPASGEKKHDFVRTHLQSSMQCQFCGKKIWLKDAEQCRDCGMTCHKKCVTKCKVGTVCSGVKPGLSALENITSAAVSTALDLAVDSPRRCSAAETGNLSVDAHQQQRRTSINPEIVMTTCPETPSKSSPANQGSSKKGLSGLLATVASAGRGLKRVGSAHNLQLPADGSSGDSLSKSLPPSPQQTPAPSRKPSLPLELSEDISVLLQTLLEHGTDQGDMMCFAKATGKTLYEDMELPERKEKIQEMMNTLKSAIDNEAEVRFTLAREEMSSKDANKKTKAAFLLGKSDEKTQALTVLMLHFCAGLQHIHDLEEQERETLNQVIDGENRDAPA